MLSEYDMTFVPQKAVKGQAFADFLASHPVLKILKLHEDTLDEFIESNMTSRDDVWQMFFDGASRKDLKCKIIAGAGVVFVSSENHVLSRAFSLMESYSNNIAEYNALLIGLQLTQQMEVWYLEAYDDSKLIINLVKREYKVWHEDLILYHHATIKLADSFDNFYISYVSRLLNTKANALDTLTPTLALPVDTIYHLTVATRHLFCPNYD